MIRHTLAAGADAYVPKNGDFELLLDAIRDKRVPAWLPGSGSGTKDGRTARPCCISLPTLALS